jgi:hypothetical protein
LDCVDVSQRCWAEIYLCSVEAEILLLLGCFKIDLVELCFFFFLYMGGFVFLASGNLYKILDGGKSNGKFRS